MLLVGITGRSGSGKSRISAHYAALGYPVADGDAMARGITGPGSKGLALLAAAFGEGILCADGSLNRAALAAIAFSRPENNQKLIEITHPLIIGRLLKKAKAAKRAGAKLFFLDGAMIVGGPAQKYCQRIIAVTCKRELAVSRIILRDGISKTAAAARLAAQPGNAALLFAASYVIENNAGENALIRQADGVLAQLLCDAE